MLGSFFTFFAFAQRIWKCGHREFQSSIDVRPIKRQIRPLKEYQKIPIRISYDTSFVTDVNSSITCMDTDQSITWQYSTINCTADDVLTIDKEKVLLDTLNNVKKFLERTLIVENSSEIFELVEYPDCPIRQKTSGTGVDLYITIYPRPFPVSSMVLASGAFLQRSKYTGRPNQGAINVNVAGIPSVSSDIDSPIGTRFFFELLLHEMCHILGISSRALQFWKDEFGNEFGNDSIPWYTMMHSDEKGKSFTILHTPKLHELLTKRWGYKYFDDDTDTPVGLELEDGEGDGTIGEHFEQRVFYNELMVGQTFGSLRISEITLTALEDTGWYTVNKTMAEPLEWGDYRSIRGATIEEFADFAIGAPALSWPDHYLVKEASELRNVSCTFDNRAVGTISYTSRSCSESDRSGECQYADFYDPNNLSIYSSNILMDYLPVFMPAVYCTDPKNQFVLMGLSGSYGGNDGFCAKTTFPNYTTPYGCFKMSCDLDGNLNIHLDALVHKCQRKGDLAEFKSYTDGYIECPDPRVVCGIAGCPVGCERCRSYTWCDSCLDGYELDTTSHMCTSTDNLFLIGVVIGTGSAILGGLTVGCVIACRSRRSDHEEDSEQSTVNSSLLES